LNTLIIGAGKVGTATAISLGNKADFHDPPKGIIANDFNKYDYIIVCVDTTKDGPDDYYILESVLDDLNSSQYPGLVAIRSTVSPEKIAIWDKKYVLNYIMFPEFMPQRDGGLVTDTAWIAVLGGAEESTKDFANNVLIKYGYPAEIESYFYVSKEEAAIIKLADNAALSTKLTYFNMIYKICEKFGVSYEVVRNAVGSDDRIGIAHSIVPSPDDGLFGFGGHCLPKDLLVIADLDKYGFFDKIRQINNKLR
jgi:UDP-glucose 6-dehydrogenase